MSVDSKQLLRLDWRKAKKSNPSGSCVELASMATGEVAMRNSRDPGGPVLVFTRAEIDAFVDGAKKHEFDDLT